MILDKITGKDILKDIKDALDTTEKITKSTTFASKAFNMLGGSIKGVSTAIKGLLAANPVGWAIAAGSIVAVVGIFDLLTTSVKEAKKALDKINSENDEITSTFESHKKTIEEVAERYGELSEGVNKADNSNISLTAEEYEEFLNINKKLSDTFPELITGFSDENGAILGLGDSAEETTAKLQALLDKEEELANREIAKNLPEKYENSKVVLDDNKDKVDDLSDSLKNYEKVLLDTNKTIDEGIKFSNNNSYEIKYSSDDAASANYSNAITRAVDSFVRENNMSGDQPLIDFSNILYDKANDTDENGNIIFRKVLDQTLLTEEQREELQYEIDKELKLLARDLQDSIDNYKTDIDSLKIESERTWQDLIPDFIADMKTRGSYKALEFDDEISGMAEQFINSLDYSKIEGLETSDEVYNYIYDNILSSLSKMSEELPEEYRLKLSDMLSGELDPQSVVNLALELQKYFDENKIGVDLSLFIENEEDFVNQYNDAVTKFSKNYEELVARRTTRYFSDGSNYVGNVDVYDRPIVINDDGSYSTTSGAFETKKDKETGVYKFIHYTPILPDGTVLDDNTLNDYINKILSSENPLEADKVENGGKGIVYRVYSEVDGEEITDANYDKAFEQADAWDVWMHEFQDGIYGAEASALRARTLLEEFFSQEGIDKDPDKLDFWEKETEGAQNAAEAIEMYNVAKGNIDNTDPLSLAGFGSNLQSKLSPGLDQLSSIYVDVKDKKYFDWSSILNNADFKAQFGEMTNVTDEYKTVYDDFMKTIMESPDDINACQEAFNKLATAYIQNSEVLKDLNEDNKEFAINWLTDNGITNAKEVVENTLQVAEAKRIAEASTKDLIDMNDEEVNALLNEAGASDIARQAIFYYKLQKTLSNEDTILTADDCNNLLTLAKTAGVTGEALDKLIRLIEIKNLMEDAEIKRSPEMMEGLRKEAEALEKEISGLAADFVNGEHTVVNYTNSLKDAADAEDELTKAMEKQKKALEDQKDELEKQKQHYEDVIEAINWFYDKQIEKQEKAIENLEKQNELIQEQIDGYDSALNAIDRFYQTEIDAIQEKIDAMDKENDAAERAIAIEKARDALEKARRNKTIRVYQHGKGFTYQSDSDAIKQAEDDLASANEAQVKAGLQAQIDKLQELRDAWSEIPNVKQQAEEQSQMIELLGANWETLLLEGRIETLTNFKDTYVGLQQEIDSNEGLIKSYEEKIEYYESLKQEWEDLTNRYQEETYIQLLVGEFGNNYENELLNGRTARWDQFAEGYAQTQRDLKITTDKIEELAKAMEDYASRMEDAATRAEKAAARAAAANALANAGGNVPRSRNDAIGYSGGGKAKGGIITKADASNLDYIARSMNEDHMIAVREGEAVIPKASVDENKELVEQLISSNGKKFTPINPFAGVNISSFKVPDIKQDLSFIKKFSANDIPVKQVSNNTTTVLQFHGDLSFPNITNGNDAQRLISELLNLSNSAMQHSNKRS